LHRKSGALRGAPDFFCCCGVGAGCAAHNQAAATQGIVFLDKKQGAAGITTAAPRIAGQWGRGDNRLPELRTAPEVVPAPDKYF